MTFHGSFNTDFGKLKQILIFKKNSKESLMYPIMEGRFPKIIFPLNYGLIHDLYTRNSINCPLYKGDEYRTF